MKPNRRRARLVARMLLACERAEWRATTAAARGEVVALQDPPTPPTSAQAGGRYPNGQPAAMVGTIMVPDLPTQVDRDDAVDFMRGLAEDARLASLRFRNALDAAGDRLTITDRRLARLRDLLHQVRDIARVAVETLQSLRDNTYYADTDY